MGKNEKVGKHFLSFKSGQRLQFGARDYNSGQGLQIGAEQPIANLFIILISSGVSHKFWFSDCSLNCYDDDAYGLLLTGDLYDLSFLG